MGAKIWALWEYTVMSFTSKAYICVCFKRTISFKNYLLFWCRIVGLLSVTIPWASLHRFYVKAAYFSNLHLIRGFVQCPGHLNVVIIALTIRPLWAQMTTMAILSVYGLTVSHSNLLLWKHTKTICSRMLLYFKINFVTNSILFSYSENSCHWH